MNSQQQAELNRHLKTFLYLSKQQPIDVVCKSAIYLIQNLPSSRHSILEYFSTLFELGTVFHVNKNNSNVEDVNNLNEVIDEIEQILLTLIKSEVWSLELFDWSLELIASLSKKYEQLLTKQQATQQGPQAQVSIIDSLHSWIQCKSAKSALEIARICIAENKNKAEIIERLLSVHSKYGSNADWIVCHLGSLCASETILYMLVLGFKEFLTQQQAKTTANLLKLNSIVTILNFFTNLHSQFIRNLLVKIFQSFLHEDYEYFKNNFPFNIEEIKQYILLYLIQLGLLSPSLLHIMTVNAKETLNPNAIENLYIQSSQAFSYETRSSLFANMKLLLRQLTNNSNEFLNYLFDLSLDSPLNEELKREIKLLLDSFFDDLNSFALTNTKETIPIVDSLRKDFKVILNDFLSNKSRNENRNKWLFNLVILLGIQGPSHITNSIMSKMLVTKHQDISTLIKYRQEIDVFDINCINYSIDSILKVIRSNKNFYSNDQVYVNDQIGIDLTLNESHLEILLNNLTELHEWDQKNEHSGFNIDTILLKADCFTDLISLNNQSAILRLYSRLGLPDKLTVDQCLVFSHNLVKFFFKTTENEGVDKLKHISELESIKQMIQRACFKYNDLIRHILLRSLIDYFFDQTKLYNFQNKRSPAYDKNNNNNDKDDNEYVSLYEQNLSLSKNLPLTKLRAKIPLVENLNRNRNAFAEKQEQLSLFNYEFMEIIEIVCSTAPVKTSTVTAVHVSPSYNNDLINSLTMLTVERFNPTFIDYQWPDVENFKLYIERDVKIQSIVEESPVCWMLLNLIAHNQSVFCKCIPTFRSLLASLILQWENVKEQPSKNCAKLLDLTVKYLNLINTAQLLEPPLSNTIDIIPLVNSYETHVILTLVWKYLKAILSNITSSTKSPVIQHKPLDKHSIDQLKVIFQRNINKLAHFYAKFFQDLHEQHLKTESTEVLVIND